MPTRDLIEADLAALRSVFRRAGLTCFPPTPRDDATILEVCL